MKFMEIPGCELSSIHALEIDANQYAIYHRNDEGNTAVVIEPEKKPRIFGSFEELTKVAVQLTAVVHLNGETYSKASFE